jgi:hypothetical protein
MDINDHHQLFKSLIAIYIYMNGSVNAPYLPVFPCIIHSSSHLISQQAQELLRSSVCLFSILKIYETYYCTVTCIVTECALDNNTLGQDILKL